MINSCALDIQSFNESLKMKWIHGYLNEENEGKWKLFLDHYLGKYGGKTIVSKQFQTARFSTAQPQGPFLKRNHAVLDKIQSQGR